MDRRYDELTAAQQQLVRDAYVRLGARYKPAMCDGAPCAGDYSFKYTFENRARNFIADWNPVLWMAPKRD